MSDNPTLVPDTDPADARVLWGMTATDVAGRVEAARPQWIQNAKLVEAEYAWASSLV